MRNSELIDKIDKLIVVLIDRHIDAIESIGNDIFLSQKRVEEINALSRLVSARALIKDNKNYSVNELMKLMQGNHSSEEEEQR